MLIDHHLPLQLQLWQLAEPLEFFADALPTHAREGLDPRWHPQRQLQYAATRYLLYQVIDPAIPLLRSERGAPLLPPGQPYVSFSHSPGYVGVLLGSSPVGLDLEQPSTDRNWETARIFMNEDELTHYRAQPGPLGFLQVWCAKEALYKVLNHQHTELSFKRELYTLPAPADAPYPRSLQAGLRRGTQHTPLTLLLDHPTPDLVVAALALENNPAVRASM